MGAESFIYHYDLVNHGMRPFSDVIDVCEYCIVLQLIYWRDGFSWNEWRRKWALELDLGWRMSSTNSSDGIMNEGSTFI